MTLDLFGLQSNGDPQENRYSPLGLTYNPFRHEQADVRLGNTPFYTAHAQAELGQVQNWLNQILQQQTDDPLSVVGSLGTGKTRLVAYIVNFLNGLPPADGVCAATIRLSDQGFARASLGALLVRMLEDVRLDNWPAPPERVLPVVWAIVKTRSSVGDSSRRLFVALRRAKEAKTESPEWMAEVISRWLRRGTLTPREIRETGLSRRIDWEGELVPMLGDLVRAARNSGQLKSLVLAVDQMEDLFRPAFSNTARARLLTDLRALIDVAKEGVPIGIMVTWTPDIAGSSVQELLNTKYPALRQRLDSVRVTLPELNRVHAVGFTRKYLEHATKREASKVPAPEELVNRAWERLEKKAITVAVTPRDLLQELGQVVEDLVDTKS